MGDQMTAASFFDRRRLLTGAALAGVAGTAAAAGVAAPAFATSGSPLVLGVANSADSDSTTLASSSAGATLSLSNVVGSPLQLVAQDTTTLPTALGPGQVAVDGKGDIQLTTATGQTTRVYTDRVALTTVTISPTRVLDTRDPTLSASIVAGESDVVNGKLKAGGFIVVNIGTLVSLGVGVRANVTVAGTGAAGFLTVWGAGPRPLASSLNWWGANQILSNTVLSQLGLYQPTPDVTYTDVIGIYASVATAVIVDVSAFIVHVPTQVVAASSTAQQARGAAARGASGATQKRQATFRRTLTIVNSRTLRG
jgi:hypothetical protein